MIEEIKNDAVKTLDESLELFKNEFIGLYDKNHNKIHEGNFVKFYYKGTYVICQIIYFPDNAMFCLKWSDGYINKFPICNSNKYEIVNI